MKKTKAIKRKDFLVMSNITSKVASSVAEAKRVVADFTKTPGCRNIIIYKVVSRFKKSSDKILGKDSND